MTSPQPAGLAPRFISRLERFGQVASTQLIVRDWLDDGLAEVCVAVADAQTAGRGRLDRAWHDQPGRTLLVSAGFRPPALTSTQAWRLPAVASVAMLGAMTSLLGPTLDRLALKWPNDIVAVHQGRVRKLGGVLAEGVSSGDRMITSVVGLGINVDWPAEAFPNELASSMWSLREASADRHVDRDTLLSGWLSRLEPLYEALSRGHFDSEGWAHAQVTTGAKVEVEVGQEVITGTAVGVDHDSGALLLRPASEGPLRVIATGDVLRCHIDRSV
jgi:BirA family transcriptional regulator, biotin operon repressor / biotin---[acetyl-CoA-carboxylase] ligase